MRNKDTGEFELVVGDKELLSGFFIGVVLLAVVFAMGYILGRSSPKSASVAADTASPATNAAENRPAAASAAVPPSLEPAASTPAQTPDASQTAAAAPAVEPPPQPTTVPARDMSAAPAAVAPPPAPADPVNATYWQVTAAASKESAEHVAQALKSQGFPAASRPGPNNLTLVWVGPYTDKGSLAAAKKKLEEAGFPTIKKP